MAAETRPPDERAEAPSIDDFLGEPTRRLADWRWLWKGDHRFPIRSHRGFWGRLLVGLKRLFGPPARALQGDLWDRQRVFNLILVEYLQKVEEARWNDRIGQLEGALQVGLDEVMRHNDALFTRVDQELDRQRRRARDLLASLSSALALVESDRGETGSLRAPVVLSRAVDEHFYLELEHRFRGTAEEIRERIAFYAPRLAGRGQVLDLGCGRGEALEVFAEHDIPARGVDASRRMVAACRERGLVAEEGDLLDVLAEEEAGSLGAVVSFHVIEHLPPEVVDRLVRLSHRALAPGGVLIVETPNPLSMVVAARNFWLDPTHLRPVHPESLKLLFRLAGFESVEHLELRPFRPEDRLPEIDLSALAGDQAALADRVNRLRDRLDELLFGFQDYALVGGKAGGGGPP